MTFWKVLYAFNWVGLILNVAADRAYSGWDWWPVGLNIVSIVAALGCMWLIHHDQQRVR